MTDLVDGDVDARDVMVNTQAPPPPPIQAAVPANNTDDEASKQTWHSGPIHLNACLVPSMNQAPVASDFMVTDITDYIGSDCLYALTFSKALLYLDVERYPPLPKGVKPFSKDDTSYHKILQDLRRVAAETAGFRPISNGRGRIVCSCYIRFMESKKLASRRRVQEDGSQRNNNNRNGGNEKQTRRRQTTKAITSDATCTWQFALFANEFGYFLKCGDGTNTHQGHARLRKEDIKVIVRNVAEGASRNKKLNKQSGKARFGKSNSNSIANSITQDDMDNDGDDGFFHTSTNDFEFEEATTTLQQEERGAKGYREALMPRVEALLSLYESKKIDSIEKMPMKQLTDLMDEMIADTRQKFRNLNSVNFESECNRAGNGTARWISTNNEWETTQTRGTHVHGNGWSLFG